MQQKWHSLGYLHPRRVGQGERTAKHSSVPSCSLAAGKGEGHQAREKGTRHPGRLWPEEEPGKGSSHPISVLRWVTLIWQRLAILLEHQATLGLKKEGPNVLMMHTGPGVNQSELTMLHLGTECTRSLLLGGWEPNAINLRGRSLLDHNTQPVMYHCFINTVLESF